MGKTNNNLSPVSLPSLTGFPCKKSYHSVVLAHQSGCRIYFFFRKPFLQDQTKNSNCYLEERLKSTFSAVVCANRAQACSNIMNCCRICQFILIFSYPKKKGEKKTPTHAKQADIHNSEMFVSTTKLTSIALCPDLQRGFFFFKPS